MEEELSHKPAEKIILFIEVAEKGLKDIAGTPRTLKQQTAFSHGSLQTSSTVPTVQ